jgi:peptidoglycan/LPS O-acetylase OafA/YrhL
VRFPALDGLRGIAALAVVTTHVSFTTARSTQPGVLGPIFARFDFGVTLFFLLSGFLLYRPMVDEQRAPATYAKRRALRVLPVYWATVVVTFLVLPANAHLGLRQWVLQLLLLQSYTGDIFHSGLTQFWSLATEVAFYVLLPLLAWVMARVRRPELVLTVMAAIGISWTIYAERVLPLASNLWLPGYLDWFALGMLLALLHARGSRLMDDLAAAPGTCVSVGLLLFGLAATPLGGPLTLQTGTHLEITTKHVLYGLSALWLLIPIVFARPQGNPWSRLLAVRPLRLLGLVSYSLFAVHQIVIYYVTEPIAGGEFRGHFGSMWLTTVVISLAVSGLVWVLIESPAISLGHRPLSQRGQHRGEGGEHEALRQG